MSEEEAKDRKKKSFYKLKKERREICNKVDEKWWASEENRKYNRKGKERRGRLGLRYKEMKQICWRKLEKGFFFLQMFEFENTTPSLQC